MSLSRLWRALTGGRYDTVRSMTVEYGPLPGAVYAEQLAVYTDAELYAHGPAILDRLRTGRPTPYPPPVTIVHTRLTSVR